MDVLGNDSKVKFINELTGHRSLQEAHNVIIGSNTIALQSAVEKCHDLSVLPILVTSELCGDAAQVCIYLCL